MKNAVIRLQTLENFKNGWEIYQLVDHKKDYTLKKYCIKEKANPSFFKVVNL